MSYSRRKLRFLLSSGVMSAAVLTSTGALAQSGSGLSGPPQQPAPPGTEGGAVAADVPQPAAATPPTGEDNKLEEIVVTAQKRAENLQTVPISVTAITGAAIANSQINNVQGLANSIPNVQINSISNSPDSAIFTIRGIGVSDADPYVGTTVSVVVDGVVVGVNTAALVSLFDIDRVEILRGPQGTLFGANTTGGVINVITKQPTGEFGGEVQVVYGNYNRLDVNAALNFPITENLAGKISILHTGMDGFFRNYADGSRLGERDITILRPYLKYTGSKYNATLIGDYTRTRNSSHTNAVIAGPGDALYTPGQTDQGINFLRGQNYSQPDKNDRDTYGISLTQNLATDIGDFVSITAFRKYDADLYNDDDATTRQLIHTHRPSNHRQFSQELRDNINIGDGIKLVLGGFYFSQQYSLPGVTLIDFAAKGLSLVTFQRQKNWSVSAFSQIYVDLTDKLRVQAGIRYAYEKTSAVSSTANAFTATPGSFSSYGDPIIPGSEIVATGKKSWRNAGWRIGADYQVDPSVLTYAYYAHGFKSGGFTGRIAIPEDIGPFNPETVDTFEIGVKSDLLDRRLRVNLSGFYNIYKDMQIVQNITYPSGANSASITNAGSAKTKGFELEVTARPVRGLTLSAAMAYLDAKYTKFTTRALDSLGVLVPVSFAGRPLMNAPKWNASVGFSWEIPTGPGYLMATGQYNYISSRFSNFTLLPIEKISPINLVNSTLGWSPESRQWSIGIWGRNIFNKKYYGNKGYLTGIGTLANVGNPREYGLDFKFRF